MSSSIKPTDRLSCHISGESFFDPFSGLVLSPSHPSNAQDSDALACADTTTHIKKRFTAPPPFALLNASHSFASKSLKPIQIQKKYKTLTRQKEQIQNFYTILQGETCSKEEATAAFKRMDKELQDNLCHYLWIQNGAPTLHERVSLGEKPFDGMETILKDPFVLLEDALPLLLPKSIGENLLEQFAAQISSSHYLTTIMHCIIELQNLQNLLVSLPSDTKEKKELKNAKIKAFFTGLSDITKEFLLPNLISDEGTLDFAPLMDKTAKLDIVTLNEIFFLPDAWVSQPENLPEKIIQLPEELQNKSPIETATAVLSICLENTNTEIEMHRIEAFIALYNHPTTTRYQLKAVFKKLDLSIQSKLVKEDPALAPPFVGYKLSSDVHKTQGAHLQYDSETGDVMSCKFTVFAPNAKSCQLIVRDYKAVQPKIRGAGGVDYTVYLPFATTVTIITKNAAGEATRNEMTPQEDGTFNISLPDSLLDTLVRYEYLTAEEPAKVMHYSSDMAKSLPVMRYYPMEKEQETGTFSFELDSAEDGTVYQYEIEAPDGTHTLKQDPFGRGETYAYFGECSFPFSSIGDGNSANFIYKNPTASKAFIKASKEGEENISFPLIKNAKTGIFIASMPTFSDGTTFSLNVTLSDGTIAEKSIKPTHKFGGASIVRDTKSFKWTDSAWQAKKASKDPASTPCNIYEMYPLLWKKIPSTSVSSMDDIHETIAAYSASPSNSTLLEDGTTLIEYAKGDKYNPETLTIAKDSEGAILSVEERSFDGSRRKSFSIDTSGAVNKTVFAKPSFRTMAKPIIAHCKAMSFTHIELLGLLGHPDIRSMGYQVSGYFTPSWTLGSLNDLKYLVNELHNADIGVIFDQIPFHFANNDFGLEDFDGTHLYGAEGKNRMSPWNTACAAYYRKHVTEFHLSSTRMWMEELHFDGVRVDAIDHVVNHSKAREESGYIPNRNGGTHDKEGREYIRAANQMVKELGGITFAEDWSNTNDSGSSSSKSGLRKEDGSLQYGLGFDQKWLPYHVYLRRALSSPDWKRKEEQERSVFLAALMTVFINGGRGTIETSHDETGFEHGSWLSTVNSSDKTYGTPLDKKRKDIGAFSHVITTMDFLPSAGKLSFMGTELAERGATLSHIALSAGTGTKADREILHHAAKEGIPKSKHSRHKDAWETRLSFQPEWWNTVQISHEELDWRACPNVLDELETCVVEDRPFNWGNITGPTLTPHDRIAKLSAMSHKFIKDNPSLQLGSSQPLIEEEVDTGIPYKGASEEIHWKWPDRFQEKLDTDPNVANWLKGFNDPSLSPLKKYAPLLDRVSTELGFHFIDTSDHTNNVVSYLRVGSGDSNEKFLFVHHLSDTHAFPVYDINIPKAKSHLFIGATKIREVFNSTKYLGHDAAYEDGTTYYNEADIAITKSADARVAASITVALGRSATMVFAVS